MSNKLLSVYVNDKEIYYVKQVITKKESLYYGVFDLNDNEIAGFLLDINAYILAIEKAMDKGNGNCIAVYPKEKRYFENYNFIRSENFS